MNTLYRYTSFNVSAQKYETARNYETAQNSTDCNNSKWPRITLFHLALCSL